MSRIAIVAFSFAVFTLPVLAYAQTMDNSQNAQRMERLEHDLMLLQRQVARGETPASSSTIDSPPANPAQLEVRLSAIQDEIRDLRGKVEENQFQVRKLSESMEKYQRDVDFRFKELTPKPALTPAADAPNAAPPSDSQKLNVPQVLGAPPASTSPAATPAQVVAPAAETKTEEMPTFNTPREHYNYAFRLLNETKYEQSAAAFGSFTKAYPKDPLVGNAYYWGGETFYIRHDYAGAAEHFRQGFEVLPDGPKAADNLLKLAMSLDALKRDKDACVVLSQLTTKFSKKSAAVTEKAASEYKRMGCKA